MNRRQFVVFDLRWPAGSPRPTPSVGSDGWSATVSAPRRASVYTRGLLLNGASLAGERDLPSDGELLSALYWQRGALEAARAAAGPVSWILWDDSRARLLVVADRLGQVPIYTRSTAAGFSASTALEALLAESPRPGPDPSALARQLCLELPAAGATFFAGVRVVRPGEILEISERGKRSVVYWSPLDPPAPPPGETVDECAEALTGLLGELGREYGGGSNPATVIVLSGGIDSTTVAAMLHESLPERQLHALTWALGEYPQSDETSMAAEAARFLGIPHETIVAGPHWALRDSEAMDTPVEGPFRGGYREIWQATFHRMAELGIDRAATGGGGDEAFGVTGSSADLLLSGRWLRLAGEIRDQIRVEGGSALKGILYRILDPIRQAYFPRLAKPHFRKIPWLPAATRRQGWAAFAEAREGIEGLPDRRQRRLLARQSTRSSVYLDTGLQARAAGVEMIHPLLDHRLLDFALRLDPSIISRAGERKRVLRRAMRGRLPASVLENRGKPNPSPLVHLGLRGRETHKVRPLLRDMRSAEMGLVDERALRSAFERYVAGEDRFASALWNALNVEDWLRRWC